MAALIIIVILINVAAFIYVYLRSPSFEEIDTELFGKVMLSLSSVLAILFILLGLVLRMMHL